MQPARVRRLWSGNPAFSGIYYCYLLPVPVLFPTTGDVASFTVKKIATQPVEAPSAKVATQPVDAPSAKPVVHHKATGSSSEKVRPVDWRTDIPNPHWQEDFTS